MKLCGFVNNMAEWMKACDATITKAGPGTIAEALICGLPLILNGFIPCQVGEAYPTLRIVLGCRVLSCKLLEQAGQNRVLSLSDMMSIVCICIGMRDIEMTSSACHEAGGVSRPSHYACTDFAGRRECALCGGQQAWQI